MRDYGGCWRSVYLLGKSKSSSGCSQQAHTHAYMRVRTHASLLFSSSAVHFFVSQNLLLVLKIFCFSSCPPFCFSSFVFCRCIVGSTGLPSLHFASGCREDRSSSSSSRVMPSATFTCSASPTGPHRWHQHSHLAACVAQKRRGEWLLGEQS
jgi:hypothetical protein